MADEVGSSRATSLSGSSSPSPSSWAVEIVRVVAPIAAATVLCALGKITPEMALAVIGAGALPADPWTLLRRLLPSKKAGPE